MHTSRVDQSEQDYWNKVTAYFGGNDEEIRSRPLSGIGGASAGNPPRLLSGNRSKTGSEFAVGRISRSRPSSSKVYVAPTEDLLPPPASQQPGSRKLKIGPVDDEEMGYYESFVFPVNTQNNDYDIFGNGVMFQSSPTRNPAPVAAQRSNRDARDLDIWELFENL